MRILYKQVIAAVAMSAIAGLALAQSVSFLAPLEGATVTSPFKVQFAVNGMAVKPAGAVEANSGHHHLLINAAALKAGESVPFDAQHLHFGKAQTEAEVTLAPGNYVLTMQFANGAHQSYGEPMSASIKVTVK